MIEFLIAVIGLAIIIPMAIFTDRPFRYDESEKEREEVDIQPLLGVAYPHDPSHKDERE